MHEPSRVGLVGLLTLKTSQAAEISADEVMAENVGKGRNHFLDDACELPPAVTSSSALPTDERRVTRTRGVRETKSVSSQPRTTELRV